ncbi:T9SS-dependent choice-of-anchor J family protein [Paraflavitalea pollutisoli]|uniref:T9SS-dependent choice-of-anchor J family protein n=1 Tax=Paraflavitalea pollutisoli TaxID=3034143 RepID=UPI0023ED4E21|nr:choice-of-anchor J domain-containing protein [Paraflavitalea sp. H1-2-19X]
MKKDYLFLIAFLCLTVNQLTAQVLVNGASYTQNFDGLATAGTNNAWSDNTTIPGWYASRTVYNAGAGASNSGALYSFGTGTATERALGGVGSGSTGTIYYGVRLKNNSAQSITAIQVQYRGEQWRNGGNNAVQPLSFAYLAGFSVTSLTFTGYTPVPALTFNSLVNTTTAAALDGNTNFTSLSATISGLSIDPGQEIMLRWEDLNDVGNDHGLAIDDVQLTFTYSADVNPPQLFRLTPANNSVGTPIGGTYTMAFTENIAPGTGNLYVKLAADNSIVQTIAANTATITNNEASVNVTGLQPLTDYYIETDNNALQDVAGNLFAGITGNTIWRFQTQGTSGNYFYSFDNCSSPALDGGFIQYSLETGNAADSVWACSDFGRGSGKALQVNAGLTKLPSQDWLISPALDLSGYNIPLLRFYSRTRFEGPSLQIKVSTNYSGTGDPAAATWTTLAGKFPNENSDVWTLSDSINLSAYKQAGVHIAWVYTATAFEAARWSIDDVAIFNSAIPAAPYARLFNYFKNLGVATSGNSSAWRTIPYEAADLSTDLNIVAPTGFELSTDTLSGTPAASLTLAPAVANGANNLFIRLTPTTNESDYSGLVTFTSGTLNRTYPVFGSSQTGTNTLDIVAWNVEWFGSTGNGPEDNDLQQTRVREALLYLDADIIALEEIVDTMRLKNVIDNMPGYAYALSYYASSAPDPTNGLYATGQKLALVYKTNVVSNVISRGLLKSSPTASSNWASGRVPFLVSADVTSNGVTQPINFLILHGKSGDTQADYNARKAGTDELKDTLDAQFSTNNVVILGDFNDDLDLSISAPAGAGPVSSYTTLISDSTDADFYKSLTLPLSLQGLRSTKANSDVIDHMVVSNEMNSYYVPGSAQLRKDLEDVLADYAITTSDHYPVIARFLLTAVLPVRLTQFRGVEKNKTVELTWRTEQESNSKEFIVERSANGVQYTAIGKVAAKGNASTASNYSFIDAKPLAGNNLYRLQLIDMDASSELSSIVRVAVGTGLSYSFGPNPASNSVTIQVSGVNSLLTIHFTDLNGRLIERRMVTSSGTQTVTFTTSKLPSGTYLLTFMDRYGTHTEQVIIR